MPFIRRRVVQMDAYFDRSIIERVPGPGGAAVPDIKLFLSKLWQNSREVVGIIESIKSGKVTPEESLELLFEGSSKDPLLFCFLVLVSLNNEAALELCDDLQVLPKHARIYSGVDEAVDWFFTIYTKEKICSGRHDYGRKRPRSTA